MTQISREAFDLPHDSVPMRVGIKSLDLVDGSHLFLLRPGESAEISTIKSTLDQCGNPSMRPHMAALYRYHVGFLIRALEDLDAYFNQRNIEQYERGKHLGEAAVTEVRSKLEELGIVAHHTPAAEQLVLFEPQLDQETSSVD